VNQNSGRPSVAVLGVGAIGTALADAVSQTSDVVLCRRSGTTPMWLRYRNQQHIVDATTVNDPRAANPADWVIVSTKAVDVGALGPWFSRLIGPVTRVVVAQNGIDHAARVREWIEEERVLPATVYVAAERLGPDLVEVHDWGSVTLPAGQAAAEFRSLMGPRIPITLDEHFELGAWRKLIMNAAVNTITAITDQTSGVMRSEGIAPVVDQMLAEGITIANASGVTFAPNELTRMTERIAKLPAGHPSSMQLDVRAGRRTEADFLTGALLSHASATGVASPTIRTAHALLTSLRPRVPAVHRPEDQRS
jgi:2-dehydropantoate 2-reductase